MKGRRRVKEGFLNPETIETWIVYVCHLEGEGARQKIYSKCLWTGYGSMSQAHRFECVKNCSAAGFFTFNSFPCVSRMVHHPKDIPPTWHTGNCWKTQQRNSSWHKPVRLAPTNIPCSKALQYFVLPIHPLNGTHTQSMSQGLKLIL